MLVRASRAADFLALLPQLIGCVPRSSLVLLLVRGTRTCGAIRLDLPSVDFAAVASRAVGLLGRFRGVESVVLVVCTPSEFGAGSAVPYASFAALVSRRIRQAGFGVSGALCHAGDGWASYFSTDVPAGGHPLSDIHESDAALPISQRRTLASLDGPNRVPDAPLAARARFGAGLVVARPLHPAFAENALGWDTVDVMVSGPKLLMAVQDPEVRDGVMLGWAVRWSSVARPAALLSSVARPAALLRGIGPRPDIARVEAAIEVLSGIVPLAPDSLRPAPLSMLAWLSWAIGRNSLATRYLGEAVALDPHDGLASLVGMFIADGVFPEWAFGVDPPLHTRPCGNYFSTDLPRL